MNQNSPSVDYSDAVSMWRSLKAYLKIDIEVEVPENPEPRSQATVRITATNTAPSGPDWPNIAYMGVELLLGDPNRSSRGDWKLAKPVKTAMQSGKVSPGWSLGESGEHSRAATLLRGEALSWEFTCPLERLADVQPRVEASIAWDMFFGTDQKVSIPSIYTRPTVLNYIKAVGSVKFWDTFSPKLKAIHLPGPDTPFVQVQALTRQMTDSLASIETIIESLSVPSSAAIGPEARAHFEAAAKYLYEERRIRQELKEAISSGDSQRIAQAENSIRDLDNFVFAVNRAAEQLIAEYSIPEQEAHGLRVS